MVETVNLGRLEKILTIDFEVSCGDLKLMRILLFLSVKCFLFSLTDSQLYSRTRGWYWFFWCCFPSKYLGSILLAIDSLPTVDVI